MYPSRYRLPEVTANVVALLERRRPGIATWGADTEEQLTEEARAASEEMGKQFAQLAEDTGYWQRIERSLATVVLPRYLRLAREQQELEKRKFDLWRGGDLISRGVYAFVGVLLALLCWRAPFIPKSLELLPLLWVLFGPLLPDLQVWRARRRYEKSLQVLVDDMEPEQQQLETYRPIEGLSAVSEQPREGQKERG